MGSLIEDHNAIDTITCRRRVPEPCSNGLNGLMVEIKTLQYTNGDSYEVRGLQ